MVTKAKNRCLICETKPAKQGAYCANCTAKIESMRHNSNGAKPVKFITYRDTVIGLYPSGKGTLVARLLKRDASHLPKFKTINLDTYCKGYSREQIKAFKRAIATLSSV